MFEVIPYKHEHIAPLLEQKINLPIKAFFTTGPGSQFESRGTAFTGTYDGVPVICGAIEHIWENRGIIWSVFNEECKGNFVPVFRAIKKFLSQSEYKRIEVSIPCDFLIGRRRAEMLGFKLECECAKKYLPDGTDCAIYAMVKE